MTRDISVIVPCYNQGQYLNECLQSLSDQTYQNWECIIVNDGSADNTEEIALEWTARDGRFKYLKKKNRGLSSARNAGINQAKGEWIQFLDCDDLLAPEKFQSSIAESKGNDVLITNYQLFNENKELEPHCKYIDEYLSYDVMLLDWDKKFTIPIHAALFKKSIIPVFNETVNAKEDWIFWLDVFKKNPRYQYIHFKYAKYRVHSKSMTKNMDHMLLNELEAYRFIFTSLSENLKEQFFLNRIIYKNQFITSQQKIENVLRSELRLTNEKLYSKRYLFIDKVLKVLKR